jgi:O-antigen/teichoic acid export membrane protein
MDSGRLNDENSPTRIAGKTELKKTFIQNLVLLIGLNLLVKPVYLLFIETEIQNRTGPDAFGSYFALINFSFLLNILPDLGITNWNTRKTAQNGYAGKKQFIRLFRLRLILAAIYIAVAFTLGMLLHYSNTQLWYLLVLALNQVLVSGILYIRSYLTGMHLFSKDSIVSVLDRLLLLLMMSWCLWFHPDGNLFQIEWLIYGQTISYAVTMAVATLFVFTGTKKQNDAQSEIISSASILKESLPFAILIMLSMIGYRADSVMLERMKGADQAGIYAMGFRFFEAINMISYLFAVLLLPMFAKQLKEKISVAPLLQLGFKVLYTLVFMVSVACCFYSESILGIFYDHSVPEAAESFQWLMMSALFFSLQYISGTLITASGKMRPMIAIALSGMLYNIILNLIYIPLEGATGAAKASCLSQLLIFIAQLAVIIRYHDTGNLRPLALRALIFTLTSIFAGYALTNTELIAVSGFSGWLLLLLVMTILALLTRMLDIRSVAALIPTGLTGRTSLTLQNQDKQTNE